MVDRRAKGRRRENEVKKTLQGLGWEVYQVSGSTKWNKQVDMFGLFDLFAIKRINNKTKFKFIQVKNRKPAMAPFNAFHKKYPETIVEIWIYENRKPWRIIGIQ